MRERAQTRAKRRQSGPTPRSTKDAPEMRWDLEAFIGQWVVVEGSEVVASAADPVKLVELARSKGIAVPYVFYVDSTEEGVVKMGL